MTSLPQNIRRVRYLNMATKTKAKPVAEELEEDLELEELDEEVEDDEAPAKSKSKGGRADDPAFGIRQLCALLEEKTGKEYKPREVRTLLRKMAREDNARINREIKADNRQRYSWEGPKDPEVLAILKAVKGGEIEANKNEALAKLKADKAAKTAAKAKEDAKASKSTKTKTKAAAPPDDDDDDVEELEDDDD